MLKRFFSRIIPQYRFEKLTDINLEIFSNKELIIFDVDNTLIFPRSLKTTEEITSWFAKINKNQKCICVSNSRTIAKRKDKISELLGCDIFLSGFKKPSKKLFNDIKANFNIKTNNVVVVGDKVFPDILFGNLNGATTVLVNPLSRKENILIKISRKMDNLALFLADFLGYD